MGVDYKLVEHLANRLVIRCSGGWLVLRGLTAFTAFVAVANVLCLFFLPQYLIDVACCAFVLFCFVAILAYSWWERWREKFRREILSNNKFCAEVYKGV